MKKIKRSLSAVALVLCLCFITPTVSFAMYSSDVAPNNQYLYEINYVLDNGLMTHTYGQQFSPNENMAREHVALLLYRLAGKPYVSVTTQIYNDIPTTSTYYKATKWLKQNGIMNGVTQTRFGLDENIIKQDVAVCLYRFASHFQYSTYCTGIDLSTYNDGSSVSDYAVNAMRWAIKKKIVVSESNNLNPFADVKRSLCAYMISTFSKTVELIKPGRDNYSFVSSSDFGINSGDFNNLIYLVNNYYSGNDKNSVISQLNSYRTTCHSNSFGLAVAAYLDKIGKLNLNAYQSGAETVYDLDDTQDNANLRSVISFYELTQYIPGVMTSRSGDILYNWTNLACIRAKNQGLYLVVLNYGSEKIPCIIYDAIEEPSGYSASFYTPDHPGWRDATLVTYRDSNDEEYVWIEYYDEIGGFHYSYLDSIQTMNSSNPFNTYDADGIYNSTPYLP